MDTKIFLDIKGRQVSEDDDNRTEFFTRGRRFSQDDALCLEYEESELNGLSGARTLVRVEGGMVSLIRSGSVQANMVFEKGRRCVHQYSTEEGMLELGVFPLKLDVDLGERRGHVDLEYQLDVNGCFTSTNSLAISYRAVP